MAKLTRPVRIENKLSEPIVFTASFDPFGRMTYGVDFCAPSPFSRAAHVHVDGVCNLRPSCAEQR